MYWETSFFNINKFRYPSNECIYELMIGDREKNASIDIIKHSRLYFY